MGYKEKEEVNISDLPISEEEAETVEKMAKTGKVQVNVSIKQDGKKNLTVKEDFVITYTDSFKSLASLKLSATEFICVAYILEAMAYGNLVTFSQSQMAKDLKMAKSNLSYYFKKLKEKGVLIENKGHTYMNSKIFQKGLNHKLTEERRENLGNAQGDLVDNEGNKVVLKPTI